MSDEKALTESEAKEEIRHYLVLRFILLSSIVIVIAVLLFGATMNLLYAATGSSSETTSIVISMLILGVGIPLLFPVFRILRVIHACWKNLDNTLPQP